MKISNVLRVGVRQCENSTICQDLLISTCQTIDKKKKKKNSQTPIKIFGNINFTFQHIKQTTK